jgi:hypothetical protein
MGSTARLAIIALALVALATGCGNDSDGTPPTAGTEAEEDSAPLTEEERRLLSVYDARIARYCLRVARSAVEPRRAPDAAEEARGFDAAEALIALAAEKPDAPLEAGGDARLFLSDVIENLEGSNCDPRMLATLQRGLAEIPLSP